MMASNNCQICNEQPFKYTCPRCNVIYCSLACYKAQQHLKCSEEFYKQCVQDELASKQSGLEDADKEDIRKIYNILKRIRDTDAGIETEDFAADGLDGLRDSDDDDENEFKNDLEGLDQGEEDESIEDDDIDIAERLKDIDINDADEVWERLTPAEREEFKILIENGDIMKLMPDFKPWWLKNQNSKIVELPAKDELKGQTDTPPLFDKIPKFSTICSKEPAPCIHYNLWNILAAYSCTVRYFNCEHLTNPNQAIAHLINLSSSLKYGTNFEDVDDAILSVEMEALTTGNGASQLLQTTGTPKSLLVESRTQLQTDARQLMSTRKYKLAALSDIIQLLQLTKQKLKTSIKKEAEFQKLFALSSGMEELTRTRVQQLLKKLEFYLSYVNRDVENDLK